MIITENTLKLMKKIDTKIHGRQMWLIWRGPAAILNDRPVLSSERAPHVNKPAAVWR
jgi:hypothetical protein